MGSISSHKLERLTLLSKVVYRVSGKNILSSSRERVYTDLRMVFSLVILQNNKKYTDLHRVSSRELSYYFGKSNEAILYGIRQGSSLLQSDKNFAKLYSRYIDTEGYLATLPDTLDVQSVICMVRDLRDLANKLQRKIEK